MKRGYKRRYIPKPKNSTYFPDFKRYEFEKTVWAQNHPRATAEEYREAMQVIAARCGI